MVVSGLNHIGNWNAQLFREWKGRLKPRNILLVVGLALLVQFIMVGLAYSQLPPHSYSTRYCELDLSTYTCVQDAQGHIVIMWKEWWADVVSSHNWLIMLTLMVPGVYLLAQDLDREEYHGTLNFIRLSPQSPRAFLVGKLLGVPVLFYLAVLCMVPFHVVAAFGAGASFDFLLSFYTISLMGSLFLFSIAMLVGLSGRSLAVMNGSQVGAGLALVMVLFTIMLYLPTFFVWNNATAWSIYRPFLLNGSEYDPISLRWFFLDLGLMPALGYFFTLANLSIGTWWLWRAMQRYFANPNSLLLPKSYSYGLVIYLELLVMGFCIHPWSEYGTHWYEQFMAMAVCQFGLALILIALFSNQRQTLLDWARFRHLQTDDAQATNAQASGRRPRRMSLLADLLWSEKSPSSLLIPLNLLLMAGFMVLWFAFLPTPSAGESIRLETVLLSQLLCGLTLMLYGAIAQLFFLMKNPRRLWFAAITVAVLATVPLAIGLVVYDNGLSMSHWWWTLLFSPVPMPFLFQEAWFTSLGTVLQGVLAHIALLAVVNGQLARQLRKAGASSTKGILDAARQG